MLLRKLSQKSSLLRKNFAQVASTVAIISGFPSADLQCANIMAEIKKQTKSDVKFIGMGGKNMN